MVALVLADALLTSFGGDSIGDLTSAVRRRRGRTRVPGSHAGERDGQPAQKPIGDPEGEEG
jgi:hypothetical protein